MERRETRGGGVGGEGTGGKSEGRGMDTRWWRAGQDEGGIERWGKQTFNLEKGEREEGKRCIITMCHGRDT